MDCDSSSYQVVCCCPLEGTVMKSTIHLIKAKLQLEPVADLEMYEKDVNTYGSYMVISMNTEGLN